MGKSSTESGMERGGEKTRRKWRKRLGLVLVAGAVVALSVVALMPKPVAVDTAVAQRGALSVTVDESGRTRVKDRFVVSAPITGDIGRIELRPGDRVAEGDVLMRIAPLTPQLMDAQSRAQAEAQVAASLASQRQARAAVARAEAARDLADQTHERQSSLVARGAMSQQAADQSAYEMRARREELTSARLGVRVADYQVRMARAALGRYATRDNEEALEVPSPIDGQVLRVLHEQEGVVDVGRPVVELGDPQRLEIAVDVLTADAVRIAPGAPVRLLRWGGEQALLGHVQRVEPSAFTKVSSLGVEEQRVNVVVDIDTERDVWVALGDGYRVEAEIQIWRAEDALQVPSSALFRTTEGWAAFRVTEGAAELAPVEVGQRAGLAVQVLSGLAEGDEVIVHPSETLEAGTAVRIR